MSKIAALEAVVVSLPTEGNAFTEQDREELLLVLVTDEDGRVGVGECAVTPRVTKAMVDQETIHFWAHGIKEHVIGADPIEALALYDSIVDSSFYHGRRGTLINALSAVDVALYDLAGKQLNKPIWKLLGGARQKRGARPYATIYPGDTRGENTKSILSKMEKIVESVRTQGITAMKIPLVGFTDLSDRQLVSFLADCRRLIGDDTIMGLDPGYRWKHWTEALWVINRIDDLQIYFFEAPLPHDDVGGYRELARRSPILVGAGEFSTGRWEAKEWLERTGVSLLHVGISRGGGFTEIARIAEMCELSGALLMPHSYSSAISDFCNFHMQTASTRVPMVEYRTVKPVTSAIRRDLTYPSEPDIRDGYVAPLQAPGLGLELNWELVDRFRRN